jgi:hypothetical protein
MSCHVQFLLFFNLLTFDQYLWNLHDMKKSARMDDADFRSMPPLKSNNDLKVRNYTIEPSYHVL